MAIRNEPASDYGQVDLKWLNLRVPWRACNASRGFTLTFAETTALLAAEPADACVT